MPTYAISGVSRGLGYCMIDVLSRDANNTVVGIVRNKDATKKKIAQDANISNRTNIHVVQGDLEDFDSLKQAAQETEKITGGAIDYLISNGGYFSLFDTFDPIGYLVDNKRKEFDADLQKLWNVNVVGQIHFVQVFMPLVLKGQVKKVISVTSGLADLDFTNEFDVFSSTGYSISKIAANMVMAKFSAQYKADGVLVMSVCPGFAEVGHYTDTPPEEMAKLGSLMAKYVAYQPNFKGPVEPEVAINDMIKVWESKSVANGDGGSFVSQYGNKQWL